MFCTTNLHNFCHKIRIWDVIWRAHKHNKKGNHIIHNRILQNLKSMPGKKKTVQHDSSSQKLSAKGMTYCYWILLQKVSVLSFAFLWTRHAEPLYYFCQTFNNAQQTAINFSPQRPAMQKCNGLHQEIKIHRSFLERQ